MNARKRKPRPAPDLVELVWLEEFVVDNMCGLCANTGLIGPLAAESPAGHLVVMTRRPCICPNGRSRRRQ